MTRDWQPPRGLRGQQPGVILAKFVIILDQGCEFPKLLFPLVNIIFTLANFFVVSDYFRWHGSSVMSRTGVHLFLIKYGLKTSRLLITMEIHVQDSGSGVGPLPVPGHPRDMPSDNTVAGKAAGAPRTRKKV